MGIGIGSEDRFDDAWRLPGGVEGDISDEGDEEDGDLMSTVKGVDVIAVGGRHDGGHEIPILFYFQKGLIF